MHWQISSDAPIYAQLIEQIKVNFISGGVPPGGRLPSVREMAAEAGVNPSTMQRALAELERSGLVYSQRTAGRFVTEDGEIIRAAKESLAREHIKRFLAAMADLGYSREEIVSLLEREEET